MKTNSGKFMVSTIKVPDRNKKPYETALCLDCEKIKVFELYETEVEAKKGHELWVKKAKNMTLDDFENHKDLVDDYSINIFEACKLRSKVVDI